MVGSLAACSALPAGPTLRRRLAVIGAGAAGLVAARELCREGHDVVVFERSGRVGGTWVYSPDTDSDPLGADSSRRVVHGSLYRSLRTNLPREVMGFWDYPFVAGDGDGGDSRRFPGHGEVLRYLEGFARNFGVWELVRFGIEVVEVRMAVGGDGRWVVRWREVDGGVGVDEVYDGVVVCNGHFSQPRIAKVDGIELWPGRQIHSHNYRVPHPYTDQVVVIIGASASAVDISRDVAAVAKQVHVSSWSAPDTPAFKQPGYENLWIHSAMERACEDGKVLFRDGSSVHADAVMHCTGYKYDFPFLETEGIVTVVDNRVGPLYKHMFPPLLAPHLSFIGLPWKVVPFPLFELQSKWLASLLSRRVSLPPVNQMIDDVEAFYANMEAAGLPVRYTHNMNNYQFEYDDYLAAQCGAPPLEEWRRKMYVATSKNKVVRPETYRDEWEDEDLIATAEADFKKHFR